MLGRQPAARVAVSVRSSNITGSTCLWPVARLATGDRNFAHPDAQTSSVVSQGPGRPHRISEGKVETDEEPPPFRRGQGVGSMRRSVPSSSWSVST